MAKSGAFFVRDISEKDSKSVDDNAGNFNSLSDNEQDLVEAYKSMLKDYKRMTQLNDILKEKWKIVENESSTLKREIRYLNLKHNV